MSLEEAAAALDTFLFHHQRQETKHLSTKIDDGRITVIEPLSSPNKPSNPNLFSTPKLPHVTSVFIPSSLDFRDDTFSSNGQYTTQIDSKFAEANSSSSQISIVNAQSPNIFDDRIITVERISEFDKNLEGLCDFTPLDPEKYKTELCRSYQVHGFCKYGIRCNFAHGIQQLRLAFRHGKYKTRNCQSYHETGYCRYGARCSFIHDPEEGILKCSIADRETLETLHHFPNSVCQHFATITWRMMETSCGSDEVKIFTSPKECISSSSELEVVEAFSDLTFAETKGKKELAQKTTNICFEDTIDEVLDDKILETIEIPREINMTENKIDNLLHDEIEDIKYELHDKEQIKSDADCINASTTKCVTKIAVDNRNYRKYNEAQFLNPKTKINYNVKKQYYSDKHYGNKGVKKRNSPFRLEDFLLCLNSCEGQQHLASWCPEDTTGSTISSEEVSVGYTPREQLVDLMKYKTELCRSFQYNRYCKYGDSCHYAHGIRDLKAFPKHPMYRTRKCFSFHQRGFCLYGSRCQFMHDLE